MSAARMSPQISASIRKPIDAATCRESLGYRAHLYSRCVRVNLSPENPNPAHAEEKNGRAAAQPARPAQPTERENEMSEETKDTIRLVMLFGMTATQQAEIEAEAAREGLPPLHYLYKLVLTESWRFSVPLVSLVPAPVR